MLDVGEAIPVVAVSDGAGESGPLQALLDRPTVLVFIKEACETTRMALPMFGQWSRHAPDVGLLAIAQDDPATTRALLADCGVEMPVVYDEPPYAASAAFDLPGVPTVVLVEDGRVSWHGSGWYRTAAEELEERLSGLSGREAGPFEGADDLPRFRPG